MVGGPAIWEHCCFSIGGKNGLNGRFGVQLASASRKALQQAEPSLPNLPVIIDWEISAKHPGIFINVDKYLVMSDIPDIPGFGWNGSENEGGNCGSWASTEAEMHIANRRKNTLLINMMNIVGIMKQRLKSSIIWFFVSLFLFDEIKWLALWSNL